MKKKHFGLIALVAVWAGLTLFAWFGPEKDISVAERRTLAKMPELTAQSLISGRFMEDFESYSLDQFPLRDSFRSLKALNHRYVFGQQDNNGVYIADGHIAELEYPLNEESVEHALKQFDLIYDLYLQDAEKILTTVVPDKGYYLAEKHGYPVMDYDAMFSMVQEGMPWASYVDITGSLKLTDYYCTDTHWKQECLEPVAKLLAGELEVSTEDAYHVTALERPFYGVYYGQAALPMEPDTLNILQSDILSGCCVYDYTTDTYMDVYDMTRLESEDLYEVYLSGAQSLLRIENPNAATDRELIVFRDSYGSSLVPLLVKDYATVTLIDVRYILPQMMGRYVDFGNQDVLFMHSSLVLNKNLI